MATTPTGMNDAYSWTATSRMNDLGTVSDPESLAEAALVTAATVVGQAQVVQNPHTFWIRCTAARRVEDLKRSGPQSAAYAVFNDGSVVVCKSLTTSSSASETVRWTTRSSVQNLLQQLLLISQERVAGGPRL